MVVGHGGGDPGAVVGGTNEHAEAGNVVFAAAEKLKKIGAPIAIAPTNLKLPDKIAWINQNATAQDFLLSVHLDSASPDASGSTIFYETGNGGAGNFAETLLQKVTAVLKLNSRGARPDSQTSHGRLGIIRDTVCPAWLLELGFLSNVSDLNSIRARGADAIAAAAIKFFTFLNPFLPRQKAWAFADVDLNDWGFDLIMDAKNAGLVGGYSDGTFRPKNSISRVEFLAILRKLKMF